MKLFRISWTKYSNDLTGKGAWQFGGRWNKKYTGILYTSENRALALLEFSVNAGYPFLPPLSLLTVTVPDEIKPEHISLKKLPKNWNDKTPPVKLAEIGTDWANSNSSLMLKVPSAIVFYEYNYLINPMHPDFKKIAKKVEPFSVDKRLEKMINKKNK
ncbi:MAG: RES family NAD+ phosphorylase [Desulfobacterales bacterium]|nr:RES family NAD+ phosphorylase [Desulfobacterales bacterium]